MKKKKQRKKKRNMAIIFWVALCVFVCLSFRLRKRPNLTVELDISAFFAQRIVHAVTDLLSFILNSFQPDAIWIQCNLRQWRSLIFGTPPFRLAVKYDWTKQLVTV